MAEKNRTIAAGILGLFVALGLSGAGYFVSTTIYKGRLASNTVTVRGFAEQDVKADLALWQIGYSLTGGNLAELYARSSASERMLVEFLTGRGFRMADIRTGNLQVTDLLANAYRSEHIAAAQRYILRSTITVRSDDVGLVDQTTSALNDLIRQGIVLTANSVDFQFTRLNDIKAPMLRAATQNARDAAQQFANDAGAAVGSIQAASQGLFSINSRDGAADPDGESRYASQRSTLDKKVRVVVSLTYYLQR